MRKIVRIVLHCTSGWNNQTTDSIKKYWRDTLGWKQVGYHKLIGDDGTIEDLAPISVVTNGVAGYNSESVHICYKGGLIRIEKDTKGNTKYIYGDTRSAEQKQAFYIAIKEVYDEMMAYNEKMKKLGKPEHFDIGSVTIVGHRDLSPDLNKNGKIEEREWVKVCPTFDAIEEYGWVSGNKGLERLTNRATY